MESLKDKVTIITGAGSGFGRCIAVQFAGYRAKLVLADINLPGTEETAKQCQAAGLPETDVLCLQSDITKTDDRKSLIDQCTTKFGRLDILINNAGIGRFVAAVNTEENVYDQVMDLNVKAHFFMSKLAAPHLQESKGCIVNISSVVGQEAITQGAAYCMSKAAIDSFTRCLALELAASGVRVNSVRPGVVHTKLYDEDFGAHVETLMGRVRLEHPLGRIGEVEDIANAVAFLASDKAAFITGQHLAVDGGRLCIGAGYNAQIKGSKQ